MKRIVRFTGKLAKTAQHYLAVNSSEYVHGQKKVALNENAYQFSHNLHVHTVNNSSLARQGLIEH